jgi:hypothetical protein
MPTKPASEQSFATQEMGPIISAFRASPRVTTNFLEFATSLLGSEKNKIHLRLRQVFIGRVPTTPLALALKKFYNSGGHIGLEHHQIWGTQLFCPPGRIEELEAFVAQHPGRRNVIAWRMDNPEFAAGYPAIWGFYHEPDRHSDHPNFGRDKKASGKRWPQEFLDRNGKRWSVHYLLAGESSPLESPSTGDEPFHLGQALKMLNFAWNDYRVTGLIDAFHVEHLLGVVPPPKNRRRKVARIARDSGTDLTSDSNIADVVGLVLEDGKVLPRALVDGIRKHLRSIAAEFSHLRGRLRHDAHFVDDDLIGLCPPSLHFEYQRAFLAAKSLLTGLLKQHDDVIRKQLRVRLAALKAEEEQLGFDESQRRVLARYEWFPPIEATETPTKSELQKFVSIVGGEDGVAVLDQLSEEFAKSVSQGILIDDEARLHAMARAKKTFRSVLARISNLEQREYIERCYACVPLRACVHLALTRLYSVDFEGGSTDYGFIYLRDQAGIRVATEVKYEASYTPGSKGWSELQSKLNAFLVVTRGCHVPN